MVVIIRITTSFALSCRASSVSFFGKHETAKFAFMAINVKSCEGRDVKKSVRQR